MGVEAIDQQPSSSPTGHRCEPELDIIFSSRDGFVWASWEGTDASVRLGRREMVAEMMQDFLAHEALGVRLANLR